MIYDSIQLLEGSKIVNATAESGTSFPVSPVEGQLFFRSDTSKMHIYNGTSWAEVARAASAASSVPRISSVVVTDSSYNNTSATHIDTAGGYIKVIGANFVSGCSVLIDSAPATAITFIDSEELRVQVPAKSTGNYTLHVVNPDGGTAIFISGVSYDPVPVWSTGSTLATAYRGMTYSVQLSATENSTITYSLASGSSLPSGITLSNTGLLSGTAPDVSTQTNYSFTIAATDDEVQSTNRSFTVTVSPAVPVDYLIIGGGGGGGAGENSKVGGAGGGGGARAGSFFIAQGQYSVTVGTGGNAGVYITQNVAVSDGSRGNDSSFNNVTAFGGGGGGGWGRNAPTGTFGGGGGGAGGLGGGKTGAGGTHGGSGANGTSSRSGGGGGAGGSTTTGDGGIGYLWVNAQYYGGGGAGGTETTASTAGAGGGGQMGSGGAGGLGGGGGGGRTFSDGGSGGSGVVIIRYPGTQKLAHVNGGSVSVSGGYVYHTFTSSGTFTVS